MALPATLRENSTWTPKTHRPSNQKIFEERMTLIKKWYSAWDEGQRWTLLEYLLRQQNDSQLLLIHSLLHPTMLPPDHDFTRVLPRYITLNIFSLLDPQSLCRAAQVCWFWKFLAESNSIWQKKCLKLGWFLPIPSLSFDYTVWKRHYIACVCQLHWNPPQAPEVEEEEDVDTFDLDAQLEETNTKKKKRLKAHQHTLSNEERKPWRDPDKNPHDTHYQHDSLYASMIGLRRTQQLNQSQSPLTLAPYQVALLGATRDSTVELPPPDSLIHPVLLEKMRLNGSPSTRHTQLTTLNIDQSQQDIHEAFYDLHKSNPFPRLPPYYVHKSEHSHAGQIETSSYTTNRPPSGRSRSDARRVTTEDLGTQSKPSTTPTSLLKYRKESPGSTRQHHTGLRSRPWTIPNDSEDDET
ncbi:F-box only protein 16-like [Halichondria panicea]|uniref:F-box only protein 16-like n=1 Tax=Halichondria panicea TaxID=6063 RepID=UPI00312B95D7